MTLPTGPESQGSSTRPYLVRALHEWCTDNGFTPYIAVFVDASVRVPMEYVKNGEIVLNIAFEATSALKLGNDTIEFKARFGGVSRDILVPVDHVVAIYAKENGQGMAFPTPSGEAGENSPAAAPATPSVVPSAAPKAGGLRLAGADASGPAPAAPAAVPGAEAQKKPQAGKADEDDTIPTPPRPDPPGAPTPRPSLKRIK